MAEARRRATGREQAARLRTLPRWRAGSSSTSCRTSRPAGAALPARPDRRRRRRRANARRPPSSMPMRRRRCAAAIAQARILFDGRRAGIAGAAFAGASTIDAIDAHDGHVLTKGHAGVALLPALLACVDGGIGERRARRRPRVRRLPRAGLRDRDASRHRAAFDDVPITIARARGTRSAARRSAARLMNFDASAACATRSGSPNIWDRAARSCASARSPTMLKDGSGWGAHAGVTAALLARDGFTGAPALTIERDDVAPLWSDLGQRWRIREQYFKAYPVCRWAQPAVEAALSLKRAHRFDADDIVAIGIDSFREAIDLGSRCRMPATTDEAQYSLPFPVAAALIFGRVGAAEIGAHGPRRSARRAARSRRSRWREDVEFSRSLSGRALGAGPHRARRRPHARLRAGAGARRSRKIRCPTRKSTPSTATWPSPVARCRVGARASPRWRPHCRVTRQHCRR